MLARFAKVTSRIVYSRDGRRIATSVLNGDMGHPGQISVFDNATGRTEMEVPEEGRSSGLYGFTADGDALYLKQADTRIGEWDLTRRTWRRTLPKFDYIVAISPDGRLLLTDEGERRAGLRDAATGELTVELESYPKVNSPDSIWLVAAFSPKGDRVAVACPDLRVRVWDTRTGKLASVVRDYAKLAKTVLVFSPDGARLVTFGLGMEMWDVETGRPTLPAGLVKHKGGAAAFSRDGRYLFIGGGARELLVRLDVGR